MGKSIVGDVVVVPFPQTDLTAGKRRPALVVATFPGDDLVLAQITTRPTVGACAIPIGRNSGRSSVDIDHGADQRAILVRAHVHDGSSAARAGSLHAIVTGRAVVG